MRLYISFIILAIFFNFSFATNGLHSFGEGVFYKMLSNPDGSFFVAGARHSTDLVLAKFDAKLNLLWERKVNFGSSAQFVIYDFKRTSDGNLLICGTSGEFFDPKGFCIKVNLEAQLVASFSFSNTESINCIYEDIQYKRFVLGITPSETGASNQTGIIITDLAGNLLDRITFGVYNQNYIKYIDKNSNGNYVAIGRTGVIGAGFEGLFVKEIDSNLRQINTSLEETGNSDDIINFTYSTPLGVVGRDGKYYVGEGRYRDYSVYEFGSASQLQSRKDYGRPNIEEYPLNISILNNGDFLISGLVKYYYDRRIVINGLATRISKDGKQIWEKLISDSSKTCIFYNGIELADGGLVCCGSFGDVSEAILYKFDADGNDKNKLIEGTAIMDLNNNCVRDTMDQPLPNAILRINDLEIVNSDESGKWIFHTDLRNNTLMPAPLSDYVLPCENSIHTAFPDQADKLNVDVLYRPIDQCPHLTVELNQPNLVKCRNTLYSAVVTNLGIKKSDETELNIEWDTSLKFVSANPAGTTGAANIKFKVPELNFLESVRFDFVMNLDCNVQTEAASEVKATLKPEPCPVSRTGVKLTISKQCTGSEALFVITNTGNQEMSDYAYYSIMTDQYQTEYKAFRLKINEEKVIRVPSMGRTIFIDVDDVNHVLPPGDYYFESLESCGRNSRGMVSTGFKGSFMTENGNDQESVSYVQNKITESDKISEAARGLSFYHFTSHHGWQEYCGRVKNPLSNKVKSVTVDLRLSSTFDLSTFQLLYPKGQFHITDSQSISMNFDNISLEDSSDAMNSYFNFKIRIKPGMNVPVDSGELSFMQITASAYFEGKGPFTVLGGYHNLTRMDRSDVSSRRNYLKEESFFGGLSDDFGQKVISTPEDETYLLMASYSFSDNQVSVPYIIKLDAAGKMKWEKVVPLDYSKNNYHLRGGMYLPGDKLLILIDRVALGEGYYLEKSKSELVILDKEGNVIKEISFWSGPNSEGGVLQDAVISKNGEIFIAGYGLTNPVNNSLDNFLVKLDRDGNMIWNKNIIINGLAFYVTNIFINNNDEIICTGYDDGRGILIAQKFNFDGELIWTKTVTPQITPYFTYGSSVLLDNDQIMFLFYNSFMNPRTGEYETSPFYLKMTKNGNYLEEKQLIIDSKGYSDVETAFLSYDKNILLTGEVVTDSTNSNFEVNNYILKMDVNGNEVWFSTVPKHLGQSYYSICEDSKHNIKLFGNTQESPPDFNLQATLVCLDKDGMLLSKANNPDSRHNALSLYPSPCDRILNVNTDDSINLNNTFFQITDINGKIILEGSLDANKAKSVNVSNLPNGVYTFSMNKISGSVNFIVNH